MADEKEANSGWFRHRRSGQVFEAEGYQYREALRNNDLEAVDGPGEKSDATPNSKIVALRERLTALGLEWTGDDDEAAMNTKLDNLATDLRAQAQQLGIKPIMPNWRPETLNEKINAERARRVQTQQPGDQNTTPPTQ